MKNPLHPVIGIIGGGQLGKMLIESSAPWNIQYNILDPDENAPCKSYAKYFIHADLKDADAIRKLSEVSDILTYEIEHINADVLLELEKEGKIIIPSPGVLKIIQDKSLQKFFYEKNNLPSAQFVVVQTKEDWIKAAVYFGDKKLVAKICKGGYDGKGVSICNTEDIKNGIIPFDEPCILEKFIQNCREISIMVASDGQNIVTWPSVEMHFDPDLNLVDLIFSPGNLSSELEASLSEVSIAAIKALGGKGVFAVELFVTPQNEILINEIAPRPHNSGHHTIEASYTSQYEQLNRILLNLPMGNTKLLEDAAMVNIIGPKDIYGDYKINGLDLAMQTTGFYLHLYKKNETRPGRKMGHFTVLAPSTEEAIEKAKYIKSVLKINSI